MANIITRVHQYFRERAQERRVFRGRQAQLPDQVLIRVKPGNRSIANEVMPFARGGGLRFGYGYDNHVVLRSPWVSKFHLDLVQIGDRQIRVYDHSSNGTLVNGRKLKNGISDLSVGDNYLEIGGVLIKVCSMRQDRHLLGIEISDPFDVLFRPYAGRRSFADFYFQNMHEDEVKAKDRGLFEVHGRYWDNSEKKWNFRKMQPILVDVSPLTAESQYGLTPPV